MTQTNARRNGGELGERRVHVVQGSFEVADSHEIVLSTILGSCVAACVRDPSLGVGGMNHFLLPNATGSGGDDKRYGVHAMEILINALLGLGAKRERLEAKVFGGARMSAGLAVDIGQKNIDFTRRFMSDEKIPIVAECLGGTHARRINFWPAIGTVRRQRVHAPDVVRREQVLTTAPLATACGDLELFG